MIPHFHELRTVLRISYFHMIPHMSPVKIRTVLHFTIYAEIYKIICFLRVFRTKCCTVYVYLLFLLWVLKIRPILSSMMLQRYASFAKSVNIGYNRAVLSFKDVCLRMRNSTRCGDVRNRE